MRSICRAFVYMAHKYPVGDDGKTDYTRDRQWILEVWPVKVDNTERLIFVSEQEIEVGVPQDFSPVPDQIKALDSEENKALAEYQRTVSFIRKRKAELLAIENKPAEVA